MVVGKRLSATGGGGSGWWFGEPIPSPREKLLWELLKLGDGELLTYVISGHGEHSVRMVVS